MAGRKRGADEYFEVEDFGDDCTTWMPPRGAKPYRSTYSYTEPYGATQFALAAGTSSNPIAVDALPAASTKPPPAKRQRKAKDPNAPPLEKREARFKGSCPQNIMDRVHRVMSQRFYMVERKRNGKELREEFSVLGSTGNVYTVVIDKMPSCDCPDARKGNHCKHILFIFLKVLQVPQSSGHWYQKALLTSELEEVFTNAPPAPDAVAHARVLEAYARATGKATSSAATSDSSKKRIPGPEDDCPICYEKMHEAKESTLTFCEECGNGLHKECFQQWAATARHNLTCVFCRAKWVDPTTAGSTAAAGSSEGYVNLASVAGLSPVRDTSTYYHGPSRRRRRYDDYDDY